MIRIMIRKKNAGKASKKQFAAVVLCEPSKYGPVCSSASQRPGRECLPDLQGGWMGYGSQQRC